MSQYMNRNNEIACTAINMNTKPTKHDPWLAMGKVSSYYNEIESTTPSLEVVQLNADPLLKVPKNSCYWLIGAKWTLF